jgi:hypothetical protein
MKTFSLVVGGIIVGAAAGLAVLYFNPLTSARPSTPDAADRTLHYQLPEQSLEFTHGDRALLPGASAAENQFWEETINRTALLSLTLNDANDVPTAVASRLLQGSTDTDLLLYGVLVNDYWLLTIPGEGSLFLQADTNLWPFLKQTFIPTWYLGRPWKGPADYQPTAGPGPQQRALIIGGTGSFASFGGSAFEQYRLTTLDPASHTVALNGELHLHLLGATAVDGDRDADRQQVAAAQ